MARSNEDNPLSFEEAMAIIGVVLSVVLMYLYFEHFEVFAFVWKLFRIPALALQDWLFPQFAQDYFNYPVSEVNYWIMNNSYRTYSHEIVFTAERNYLWPYRIFISAVLLYGALQVSKHKKIGAKPLDAEDYIKLVAPLVPGEEALTKFNGLNIPLMYDFNKTPNQNAFRMPVSTAAFISCYPPIGFSKSEVDRPIAKGRKWEDYDRSLALDVLRRQLGPKCPKSLAKFPPHAKDAVSIMLKRMPAEDRKKALTSCFKRHYYLRTFVMGMLKEVHTNVGVEPPKRYRFILHHKDRVMYLGLHGSRANVGYEEVKGLVSHFNYEMELNRAINEPQLKEAIDDLDARVRALQVEDTIEENMYA